jgi:hypothetical protein
MTRRRAAFCGGRFAAFPDRASRRSAMPVASYVKEQTLIASRGPAEAIGISIFEDLNSENVHGTRQRAPTHRAIALLLRRFG